MKKNVTIYQIAEESCVSVSTVSRVINGSPHVSKKTLARVLPVIEKYKFTPSAAARAMNSNHTNTLGVITSDIVNPYFAMLFLEIQRYALENRMSIILCNTLYGGASHGIKSPFTEAEYINGFRCKDVDGVIITGGEIDKNDISDEYLSALNHLTASIPVLIIGPPIAGCDCQFLNRSLSGGFPALVRHLAALGNKRVGFVGGEPGVRQTTARLQSYKTTLDSLGLEFDERIVALSNFYIGDGYTAMNRLLSDGPRPHAVVAVNDAVAIGAIRAIHDRRLRCPEDIAVVSGDQFFESDFITPRLTSVDQQNEHLGRLSILSLISAINGVKDSVGFIHDPQIIVRESCGARVERVFS
ncbi:MAG: LacI family transcriptional regulator [Clostridiales bacterium]|nr:LacI family transcriptional regulator [Clostridiales bacterium]